MSQICFQGSNKKWNKGPKQGKSLCLSASDKASKKSTISQRQLEKYDSRPFVLLPFVGKHNHCIYLTPNHFVSTLDLNRCKLCFYSISFVHLPPGVRKRLFKSATVFYVSFKASKLWLSLGDFNINLQLWVEQQPCKEEDFYTFLSIRHWFYTFLIYFQ